MIIYTCSGHEPNNIIIILISTPVRYRPPYRCQVVASWAPILSLNYVLSPTSATSWVWILFLWAIKLEASSWPISLCGCFRESCFGLRVATTIQTSHRPTTGQLHRRKWFVTRPHTHTLRHPMTTTATQTSVPQNIQEFRPALVTHNFLPWPFKSTVSKWWVLLIPLHHRRRRLHSCFPFFFRFRHALWEFWAISTYKCILLLPQSGRRFREKDRESEQEREREFWVWKALQPALG